MTSRIRDPTRTYLIIWNYRTLFGVEALTFGIVHSILTDQSFNLDVNALVGKVHTISAKQKTISAESIQFRKCLIGFCKRSPSPRIPSLGQLLSRLPCDSPWVFPDRPNFHVRRTFVSKCTQLGARKQSAPLSEFARSVTGWGRFRAPLHACLAFDWKHWQHAGAETEAYQQPTEGSDAPSSTAGNDYIEVAARLQIKPGTAWSIFARYQRTGEVACKPRGGAQHHRLDDKSKDLLGPILPRWGRRHVPTMSPLYVPTAPFHRTSGQRVVDPIRWRVQFSSLEPMTSQYSGAYQG